MPLRPAAVLALGLLAAAPSLAEPMRVVEVSPAARTVMDGNRQEFVVRFSEPVDHGASRLVILRQDGELVRTLAPRLGAAPDTLYANAGGLAPGAYRLRWEARSRRGGMPAEGTLDFQVH
jgi:copper resistance protein C